MSKTNHPRVHGTHRALSVGRDILERGQGQNAQYGTPRRVVEGFRSTGAVRITEGLAQMAVEVDLEERFNLDALHYEAEVEYMAYLDEIADAQDYRNPADVVTEDEDDEDFTYPGSWMAQSVDEAFPDGGYCIEGPSVRQPSVRAAGYLRVHEAADVLECTSESLIHRLRYRGEWVANASAYVARPVIEALYAEGIAPFISGELCLSEPKTIDPLDALRVRLSA